MGLVKVLLLFVPDLILLSDLILYPMHAVQHAHWQDDCPGLSTACCNC